MALEDKYKRINPKTNFPFQKGETRDDGKIFYGYRNPVQVKTGYYQEMWESEETRDRRLNKQPETLEGELRINPETKEPFKRGDVDERGFIFVRYKKGIYSTTYKRGYQKEVWYSKMTKFKDDPKKLALMKERQANPPTLKERRNPTTNKPFKKGDTEVQDGIEMFFVTYTNYSMRIDDELYRGERWEEKKDFFKNKIKNALSQAKNRAKSLDRSYDLDLDWAVDNLPKDLICPALKIKMDWFDDNAETSPSLDRISNNQGYVKNNVVWVSHLANSIKRNATTEQLINIAKFYTELESLDVKVDVDAIIKNASKKG